MLPSPSTVRQANFCEDFCVTAAGKAAFGEGAVRRVQGRLEQHARRPHPGGRAVRSLIDRRWPRSHSAHFYGN
jgi:hypothetical protein